MTPRALLATPDVCAGRGEVEGKREGRKRGREAKRGRRSTEGKVLFTGMTVGGEKGGGQGEREERHLPVFEDVVKRS